ncbi:MAG: hypothetical protein KTQ13_10785 [Ferruginibacter sp.]|nr:hypothetical protein [Chitinophagaceae bacterium]MBP6287587.1 hypothetical protein [Ferruginibacter sp.]MBU9937129.1 hypothetical protein [Ferruginibacter sp.]
MKSIEELQSGNSTFSISDALSEGWALISKHLGYYILGGILAVFIGMAAGIIPFVGSLANNLILSPCFMAGGIYITWRISRGIPWTDFGEMFKGFNYLAQVMVSSLIETAVMVFLLLMFFFNLIPQIMDLISLSQGQGIYRNQAEIESLVRGMFLNARVIIMFLLFMVAALLISVIWAFKLHFIVIYKMEAWPAMELSRKVSTRNLLPLIGLFILLGIIILISALPCGIGLLFSLPLSIGAVYSAFAQITQCNQPDEIELDYTGERTV